MTGRSDRGYIGDPGTRPPGGGVVNLTSAHWERMHFHENELRGWAELERDRYKSALESIVRHADMPAGEAQSRWEAA